MLKTKFIFPLIFAFTLSQALFGMQPRIGQMQQLQSFTQEIRQRLIERFGPPMTEIVLRAAVGYMHLKDKYFPRKPEPQFDPIKYLAVGTFNLINRNKINIGLTSSTILTILMLYISAKTWYEHSQERDQLNKQLLSILETDKTTSALSNAYNQFPEFAKSRHLKTKIDRYELAVNELKKTNNQQNKQNFCNAFSQLWLALY